MADLEAPESKLKIMYLGVEKAERTMLEGLGGPFGAVIVKGNEVISISSNCVLASKDPTAHAEIVAIREACKKLNTYDLSGCELYATGYPCPMCLGAIMWANIKKVYVCGLPEDCKKIGFRDDFMYDYIVSGRNDDSVLKVEYLDRAPAISLYAKYADMQKIIY